MAVAEDTEEIEPPKKSKLPMILGLVLALAGGGGGFFAMYSGMLGGSGSEEAAVVEEEALAELPEASFVELPPLVVSINGSGNPRLLRFKAQLETPGAYQEEVVSVVPRIVDVLNSYLRAVDLKELEDRAGLPKLRAQMLRRVQIVTGKGRVRDLLVMEFVVN